MRYKIVQYQQEIGVHIGAEGPIQNLAAAAGVRGFDQIGLVDGGPLRAELQGMPRFRGLAGPMWDGIGPDGEGVIRYEDYKACEILSA